MALRIFIFWISHPLISYDVDREQGGGFRTWKEVSEFMNVVCRRTLVFMLAFALVVTMSFSFGFVNVKAASKSASKTKVLLSYVLVGNYSAKKLNYVKVSKTAKVYVWNKKTKKFKKGVNNKKTILGNFVQLEDNNGNKTADVLKVVKRADSTAKWNKNMTEVNPSSTHFLHISKSSP